MKILIAQFQHSCHYLPLSSLVLCATIHGSPALCSGRDRNLAKPMALGLLQTDNWPKEARSLQDMDKMYDRGQ